MSLIFMSPFAANFGLNTLFCNQTHLLLGIANGFETFVRVFILPRIVAYTFSEMS
ncbi:hypothetical protein [Pontibacter indicus]|uniref:hypothetical protein n=1 Tax=Pontibacter indicus TaxID=1317125 RepID=UPI00147A3358|nr:hypothetical protein [Pontibacter indicus]